MMNYRHTNKLSMLYLWFNKSYSWISQKYSGYPTALLIFWPRFDWNYRYLWNDKYSTHAEQLNLNDFLYTALPKRHISDFNYCLWLHYLPNFSRNFKNFQKIFQFYNVAPRKQSICNVWNLFTVLIKRDLGF